MKRHAKFLFLTAGSLCLAVERVRRVLCGRALRSRRPGVLLPLLLLGLCVMASPMVAASADTFVLSNEGSNGFVTQLLAAGYGYANLYQALVAIQANTDPSVARIITPAFLGTLENLPASSAIFTTKVKNINFGSQGIAVSTDGTVQVVSIFGWALDNGTNTLGATFTGVGLAYFTHSAGVGTALTSFTVDGTTYNVFGVAWMPGSANTFVLSNEGANGFISQLLAGGYGNLNLYQTLGQILADSNPSVSGMITPAFLNALRQCSGTSAIFTTVLKNVNAGSQAVAISDDCTVQNVSISGAAFYAAGAATLSSEIAGVGRALFTHSASVGTALTSFTSGGTTYNVFGVAWAPPSFSRCDLNHDGSADASDVQAIINQALGTTAATADLNQDGAVNVVDVQIVIDGALNLGCAADSVPVTSAGVMRSQARTARGDGARGVLRNSVIATTTTASTFVLGNEGTNGLVTQLVAGGYGNYNVYQALVAIRNDTNPSVAGIITTGFMNALASLPASSAIFTTPLSGFSPGSQALAISTDGSVQTVSIFGASYQGKSGIATLVSNINGVGSTKFLSGTITSFTSDGNTYNVFGIAFSGEETFVLSNEGTNGFITQLLAGGYGNLNLYEGLVTIQTNTDPSVAGIITPAFLRTLASLPASSAIFTTPLKDFSPGSQALAVSTDGTVQLVSISGAALDNGTNTLGAAVSGVTGLAFFTHSAGVGTVLTSFTSGGTTYNVFGVAWAPRSFSRCDLNQDGSTNASDVQAISNQALGSTAATGDLNQDGAVNVVDIQIVIDGALNLGCAADSGPVTSARVMRPQARTARDQPLPSVISFMPPDGASGVALNSTIVVNTSEPIGSGSARTGAASDSLAIFLTTPGGPQAKVIGWFSFTGSQIVFTPASPFEPNSSVTVYAGNRLHPASATFTTAPTDTAAPHVTSVTPPDGATAVGPNTPIVLTFDRPLNPATLTATSLRLSSASASISARVTRSLDSRTITLAGRLPPGAPIELVATSGVTDLAGNRLVDFRSSFTTALAAPAGAPAVVSMRPGNGATGVPASASISLVTSAPVDASTIAGALHAEQNGILISGTTHISANGHSIQFTPDAPFAAGALVQVFLTDAATDIYGSRLDNYYAQFTVAAGEAVAAPTVVSISPANTSAIDCFNPVIDVRFAAPLDATSVNSSTFYVMQNDSLAIDGTLSLFDPYTIRFVPNPRTLSASGQSYYRVNLTSGIQGANGVAFAGSVGQYSFSIAGGATPADGVSPTVTLVAPADDYTIGHNAVFRAIFSKPIDPLSLNAKTLQIAAGGLTAIPVSISFDADNRGVTVTPQAPLPDNASVSVAIAGITDCSGNEVTPLTAHFLTLRGPDIPLLR